MRPKDNTHQPHTLSGFSLHVLDMGGLIPPYGGQVLGGQSINGGSHEGGHRPYEGGT